MIRFAIFIAICCTSLCVWGQTDTLRLAYSVSIDSTIKDDVEKNISPATDEEEQNNYLIYNNRELVDLYLYDEEHDRWKLGMTTILANKQQDRVFKSFHYWKGDTLLIEGTFGRLGGPGFLLKIIKDKARLYNLVIADTKEYKYPIYAYHTNDSLVYRLEIPCSDTKIILSEMPTPKKSQLIFGYVEFNGGEAYQCDRLGDGGKMPLIKFKANMKIYFKSAQIRPTQKKKSSLQNNPCNG